nr:probable serine/threonine-protein kinase At1g54610 [Ipomoea batatas]
MEEASYAKNSSEADVPFSGPLQVSGSSGFSWAKRRSNDSSVRSRSRSSSRSLVFEPSIGLPTRSNLESKRQENGELRNGSRTNSKGQNSYENAKRAAIEHWSQLERPDSFDASDSYHSQDLSLALYLKEEMALKRMNVVQDHGDKVEFSGPLLSQSHRVDELLEKHERHIRQAVRRSWFQRVARFINIREWLINEGRKCETQLCVTKLAISKRKRYTVLSTRHLGELEYEKLCRSRFCFILSDLREKVIMITD